MARYATTRSKELSIGHTTHPLPRAPVGMGVEEQRPEEGVLVDHVD
eukprot:COSAG02_NODE_65463_length_258_cov_0.628931_1_plen_45_part_01